VQRPLDPSPRPFHAAGSKHLGAGTFLVEDPAEGVPVARVAEPTDADVELALAAAHGARRATARLPVHVRKAALEALRDELREHGESFALDIARCVGKPITYARAEVARATDTFDQAAALCTRARGELLPVDSSPRGEDYLGLWRREPVGVVALVTPFNFPLNLVAHKIAPALVAGCPFVLKPAREGAPIALALGDVLERCGLPAGAFAVVPARDESCAPLVEDQRVALVSFTGSAAVGWRLARRAAGKRLLLELGGIGTCIVDADADVADAARRIATGAFAQAGQSCISVQRVLVHASRRAELEQHLVASARACPVGPPLAETTVCGPLLRERDAERVEQWIARAVDAGGRLVCGGTRRGRFVEPTLVAEPPPDCELSREEVFGPVATLASFGDFDELLGELAAAPGGLHVGLFTRDLERALAAFDELDVGGLVVGDVPTVRSDLLPYGGRGASGLGREGVAFAVEAMSEPKSLLVRRGRRP
jgi:acyl-CoA reductase-like NAD-dependent aldehyde dehydrogenase